jgi:hypothetical protein
VGFHLLREIFRQDDLTTAARLDVPLARFIRETMQEKLSAMKAKPAKDKPLGWMIGLARIEDTGLAARVDDILYKSQFS